MFNSRSLRCVLIGSLLTVSSVAMAATDTVVLGGSVAATLEVVANQDGGATVLPLDGLAAGVEKIIKVADITTSTNNEQGFSIVISDLEVLAKVGGSSIPYKTETVLFLEPAPIAAEFDGELVGMTGAGSLHQDLYIKYTPATLQDPGLYEGLITITVADL